jgi:hypothetical protein
VLRSGRRRAPVSREKSEPADNYVKIRAAFPAAKIKTEEEEE